MSTRATVVILGGGFAGLRALHRLTHLKDVADVILVDPRSTSLAKPVLPEVALAGKSVEHARFTLEPLVTSRGARFVHRGVDRVETTKQLVVLDDTSTLHYDFLLVALGALKDYDAIPGFREYGFSVCDDIEAPRLAARLESFTGGPVVIGSAKSVWGSRVEVPELAAPCEGPVAEILFMIDRDLSRRNLRARSPIQVFSPGQIFFEDVGPKVHDAVGPMIEERGIKVTTATVLDHLEADRVVFTDGSSWESALSIVLPPYAGNPVVKRSPGLGDERGFIPTDKTMRHLDAARVYAAGDGTSLSMPKLGHIAVMQADVAAGAILQDLTGRGEVPQYHPEVFCIASRGGLEATLILSDTLFGGTTDLTLDGPIAHLMKWGFDSYYFHTPGRLPPDLMANGLEGLLREVRS